MGNLRWKRITGLALLGAGLTIRGAEKMYAIDLEKPVKDLHTKLQDQKHGKDAIIAVEYLADTDCYYYPEAQHVLLETVEHHPNEDVRYAAAKGLFAQLQRGRRPLNPNYGWREVPDPLVFEQISRLASFCVPLTYEEQLERYANRKLERDRRRGEKEGRGDFCHGCCDEKALEVLLRVAFGKDDNGCYFEPSDRVRKQAERAIQVVMGREALSMSNQPMTPDTPMDPAVTPTTPSSSQFSQPDFIPQQRGRIPFAGRADTANRLNLFDNMSVEPRTRVFGGYQFIYRQNNAIKLSSSTSQYFGDPFFTNPVGPTFNVVGGSPEKYLNSIQGQQNFIQATGFGQGLTPTFPAVVPDGSEATAQALRREFLTANGNANDQLRIQGNSNLYRLGFEYAVTMDTSILMQAQFLQTLDPLSIQPDAFSNPLMIFKQVLYRDEDRVLSGMMGYSPQISQKDRSIVERTSRFMPGLSYFQEINEDFSFQAASGFSLPTRQGQVATWDYILGLNWYMYRHESLLNPNIEVPEDKLILAVIPQFEVIGKHIMGDSTVRGPFGLNSAAPRSAIGAASSFTDSSGTLLQPSTGLALNNSAFEFEEPRHVVDLTAATSILLRRNQNVSLGVSFPVTGGAARQFEFFTTYGWSF